MFGFVLFPCFRHRVLSDVAEPHKPNERPPVQALQLKTVTNKPKIIIEW